MQQQAQAMGIAGDIQLDGGIHQVQRHGQEGDVTDLRDLGMPIPGSEVRAGGW